MDILRSIPSDGTYSHNNVGNYAQEKTKEKSFIQTSDMTAFTDLFPSIIQQKLLYCIETNQDLAKSWWTLLAERTFTLAWSGEHINYGSGQPMGAYASWALCTLSHHLIVHYCANKLSIKKVNSQYRIIGDDNIITNKLLGNLYQETLASIGCKLNPGKGTVSQQSSENSSAEVAKQLFHNGINISPLTPGLVKNLTNVKMLNSTLINLVRIYEDHALPCRIINCLIRKKEQEMAWVLCLNPFNGVIKPSFEGYDDNFSHYWGTDVPDWKYREVLSSIRRQRLINLANQLTDIRMGP
jgi:hypothetical protein